MTTYLSAGVMSVDWVHECLERSKPVVNRSYSQKTMAARVSYQGDILHFDMIVKGTLHESTCNDSSEEPSLRDECRSRSVE
jgi:hypothetical protein